MCRRAGPSRELEIYPLTHLDATTSDLTLCSPKDGRNPFKRGKTKPEISPPIWNQNRVKNYKVLTWPLRTHKSNFVGF
ncbi:hypothetical protein COLO4_14030 [Corchorus olitorius]|uniref:Uncharacterized protein n=1 Tax=Corchorus olitorius TaxID=93759 RepID=A0A1R3JU12_9ROSI|nr:hypothetical protein COLO4_14030 [Corchorus olitorius]